MLSSILPIVGAVIRWMRESIEVGLLTRDRGEAVLVRVVEILLGLWLSTYCCMEASPKVTPLCGLGVMILWSQGQI